MDYIRNFYLDSIIEKFEKNGIPEDSTQLSEILLGAFLSHITTKALLTKSEVSNTIDKSSENNKYETVQTLLSSCSEKIIIGASDEISQIYLGGKNIGATEGIENLEQLDKYINTIFGHENVDSQGRVLHTKESTYLVMYSTLVLFDNIKRRGLNNFEFFTNSQFYDKYFLLLDELVKCTDKDKYDRTLSYFMELSKFIVNKFSPIEWMEVWVDETINNLDNFNNQNTLVDDGVSNDNFEKINGFDRRWNNCYYKLSSYVVASSVNQIYSNKFKETVWTTKYKSIDKSLLLAYMEECNLVIAENNKEIEELVLNKVTKIIR